MIRLRSGYVVGFDIGQHYIALFPVMIGHKCKWQIFWSEIIPSNFISSVIGGQSDREKVGKEKIEYNFLHRPMPLNKRLTRLTRSSPRSRQSRRRHPDLSELCKRVQFPFKLGQVRCVCVWAVDRWRAFVYRRITRSTDVEL